MKISNREIIIAAIAILVLLGIGYFINQNSEDNNQDEQQQEEQVNLDENKDDSNDEAANEEKPEGIVSTEPASGAEIALTKVPDNVIVKSDREMTAGSVITVVSEKNIDVVTAGNRLTTDLKQLSAPVDISAAGVYTVAYKINWKDGTSSEGGYKFTVK